MNASATSVSASPRLAPVTRFTRRVATPSVITPFDSATTKNASFAPLFRSVVEWFVPVGEWGCAWFGVSLPR